jgi:hypothetical protein
MGAGSIGSTMEFTENREWIAAAELRGPAGKSSASNGSSDYQLDISGNIESQLRERSIPLMIENQVKVKQLTEHSGSITLPLGSKNKSSLLSTCSFLPWQAPPLSNSAPFLGIRKLQNRQKVFSEKILENCVAKFWSSEERVYIDNKPWMVR